MKLDPSLQIEITQQLDDLLSRFRQHIEAEDMHFINQIKAQKSILCRKASFWHGASHLTLDQPIIEVKSFHHVSHQKILGATMLTNNHENTLLNKF